MNIQEIKRFGKEAFKANYWRCVLVAFLLSLLTMGTAASSRSNASNAGAQASQDFTSAFNALSSGEQMAFVGVILGASAVIILVALLLRIFLFNPLQVGGYRFFRKNLTNEKTAVGTVAEGFGQYGHTFLTLFLRDLFLFLWSLLLFIPGIVKAYSYMLVPYLLKDEPNLSATETITRSKELMNGHKWDAFMMDLSFIGWFLLGLITLNLVNIFWTNPYHESARAKFYSELLRNA